MRTSMILVVVVVVVVVVSIDSMLNIINIVSLQPFEAQTTENHKSTSTQAVSQ